MTHPEDVLRERMMAQLRADKEAISARAAAVIVPIQPVKLCKHPARPAAAFIRTVPKLPRVRVAPKAAPKQNHTGGKEKRRITIRGVDYASLKEASEAVGVTRQTIVEAVKRGTLDRVGLGSKERKLGCTLVIDGVEYASQSEAARALGVSAYTAKKLAATLDFTPRVEKRAEARKIIREMMAAGAKITHMVKATGLSRNGVYLQIRALQADE